MNESGSSSKGKYTVSLKGITAVGKDSKRAKHQNFMQIRTATPENN
jgi:hypothetical protein